MENLSNTTFIIPIKIDSNDRLNNLSDNLGYLLHNFSTIVTILEADNEPKTEKIIQKYKGKNLNYIFIKNEAPYFHRTKYLNIMLDTVETDAVVNYDVDIFFPIPAYIEAQKNILEDGFDMVHPFYWGPSQRKIHQRDKNKLKFRKSFNLSDLDEYFMDSCVSESGGGIFFKTNSYREGFMENEDFISYGPEDKERLWRFLGLGYKVRWNNNLMYHLEHYRGPDSWRTNSFYKSNLAVYGKFLKLFEDKDLQKKLYNGIPVNPKDVPQKFINPDLIKRVYSKLSYVKKYRI